MMSEPVQAAATVRDVVAGLAQARDAQIARVVAMVDGLPERGAADALIAPLRARLAQLRPARPFSFTRLLFSPLDPVIIPGQRWKRGDVGLPRQALAPLGVALQAALPALSRSIEPSACRVAPDDRPAIAALGEELWPAAASAMQQMAVPANWEQASGLAPNDFTDLAAILAAVLGQAPAIEQLAASRSVPADADIRALLVRTEPQGGLALATMVAVLLSRLPVPSRVLAIAAESAAASRNPAADRAMDHTLANLQATMADGAAEHGDATEAAVETIRIAALLAGLEDGPTMSPERRQRLEQIRKDADTLCRRRFDHAVAETLQQASVVLEAELDDAVLDNLERTARDLRRLESAGRRLGSAEHYDATVLSVSARFRDPRSGLGLADRVRLVEILCGPDEALALLLSDQG